MEHWRAVDLEIEMSMGDRMAVSLEWWMEHLMAFHFASELPEEYKSDKRG